jgi:hypothetical protein
MIFVFDEVHILFHFNIILKHNRMSSPTKTSILMRKNKTTCHSFLAEVKYYENQKVCFDEYRRCLTIILSCRFQHCL